ncbi:MAG: DUF4179 domain-containing protein [Bacillota bacterium]
MAEIENMLKRQGEKFNRIEPPEEMEERLRQALEHSPRRKRAGITWLPKVAVLIIALFIFSSQIDTLAYYGKKLLGYDQVMSGTLRELNELGSGQTIGKSYTFKNGVSVTLDGIMLDDNQMLVFYTIKDPKGTVDELYLHHSMSLKGLFKEYQMYSGQGNMNEEKTEMKNMLQFQTPLFFEKKLKLSFSLEEDTQREIGEIPFTLDWTKAMGHTIKKSLNKVLEVDGNKIRFDSITASPTTTVIKGQIQSIWELARDEMKGERMRPNHIDLKLIANGKEVPQQSSGMSTDMKGIIFHQEFDALPKDLKELQLQLASFAADHDVYEEVELNINDEEKSLEILGQKIVINEVFHKNEDTFIKITTEESVVLTQVDLIIDNEKADLIETTSDQYEKKPDGTILHTRILHFPGSGSMLKLNIQRITYEKNYHKTIDIPLD